MGKKANNPFGLTDQQLSFADAYHRGGCTNAYQAGIEAGYSEKYSKVGTGKLLDIVNPYLKTLQAKTAAKNEGEREKNIELLKNVRDFDILEAIGEVLMVPDEKNPGEEKEVFVNSLKDLRNIPKAIRRCIGGIESTRYGVKVKFHDPLRAVEIINRMCGYNEPDKVEHSVTAKEEEIKTFFGGGE